MSSSSWALIPPTSGREDGRENIACSTSVAAAAAHHHPLFYCRSNNNIEIIRSSSNGERIENCVTTSSIILKVCIVQSSADVEPMCHAVLVQLMEVTAATDSFASNTTPSQQHRFNSIVQQVQQQQRHYDADSTSSPVPLVLALANAGKRVFEPQRVISDYHADILRFASPSNAFIKTYGIIFIVHRRLLLFILVMRETRSSSACV